MLLSCLPCYDWLEIIYKRRKKKKKKEKKKKNIYIYIYIHILCTYTHKVLIRHRTYMIAGGRLITD